MDRIQTRNLSLLVAGRLISLIGSGVQMIALPLFILDMTHDGLKMGLFATLTLIPALVILPLAGVVGDRHNRKTVTIRMDLGRAAIAILLSVLAWQGMISFPVLAVCQMASAAMDSFFNASTVGFLPQLVPADELTRANAAKYSADGVGYVVGPALGGILYAFGGIQGVLVVNGISFLLSALLTWRIRFTYVPHDRGALSFGAFFHDMREVFHFARGKVEILQLGAYAMVFNLLAMPLLSVVLPVILREDIRLSSVQYGLMQTTFMAGLLLGNVVLAVFLSGVRPGPLMKTGIAGLNLMFLLFAGMVSPAFEHITGGGWRFFGACAPVLVLIGVSNAISYTPIMSNLQKAVPEKIRSRLFASLDFTCMAATPAGTLIYGILLSRFPGWGIMLVVNSVSALWGLLFIRLARPQVFSPESAEAAENEA